ncbi:MAG: Lrp/AsnC family transcriptional regulator [Bacteroidota bacterium]
MAELKARLLEMAQEGLPLEPRPFLALANRLNVTEDEVLAALGELERDGIIREISAFLDPKRLGYRSTLACMIVPPERIDEVTALLAEMPEVTHNYLRDHQYNMWFTLIAPSNERVERILGTIERKTGCGPIHNLPAETMFKIRVAFSADQMSP